MSKRRDFVNKSNAPYTGIYYPVTSKLGVQIMMLSNYGKIICMVVFCLILDWVISHILSALGKISGIYPSTKSYLAIGKELCETLLEQNFYEIGFSFKDIKRLTEKIYFDFLCFMASKISKNSQVCWYLRIRKVCSQCHFLKMKDYIFVFLER